MLAAAAQARGRLKLPQHAEGGQRRAERLGALRTASAMRIQRTMGARQGLDIRDAITQALDEDEEPVLAA